MYRRISDMEVCENWGPDHVFCHTDECDKFRNGASDDDEYLCIKDKVKSNGKTVRKCYPNHGSSTSPDCPDDMELCATEHNEDAFE